MLFLPYHLQEPVKQEIYFIVFCFSSEEHHLSKYQKQSSRKKIFGNKRTEMILLMKMISKS